MPEQFKSREASDTSHQAAVHAEEILRVNKWDDIPVDPFVLVERQGSRLRIAGEDFGDDFDGQLEYFAPKKRFLLFYNTKYDAGYDKGLHHPRTRFSIAHELGHYFLDHHRQLLIRGRRPHKSNSEFRTPNQIEREADAFAASLLLPTFLLKPAINQVPLTWNRLERVAAEFATSLLSTAIRSVQLSDFPTALIGIRDGQILWSFVSGAMIRSGIYPKKFGAFLPTSATRAWHQYLTRSLPPRDHHVRVSEWLDVYKDKFANAWACESFKPAYSLGIVMALVTIEEGDLAEEEADYESDEG